jgi:hypothetical protein
LNLEIQHVSYYNMIEHKYIKQYIAKFYPELKRTCCEIMSGVYLYVKKIQMTLIIFYDVCVPMSANIVRGILVFAI